MPLQGFEQSTTFDVFKKWQSLKHRPCGCRIFWGDELKRNSDGNY